MTKTANKTSSLQALEDKFEAMSLRERKLLFACVPILLIIVIFFLLIEPSVKASAMAQQRLTGLQDQLRMSKLSMQAIEQELTVDPNVDVKQQIRATQEQIERLQLVFDSELDQLVPPRAMPILLEQVLQKADKLNLQSMQSIPPVNVFADQQDKADLILYKHGIKLRFEGDYFTTRNFLADTEALGWKLYWREVSYAVADYPNAVIDVEVFTLSTHKEFLSVE